MRTDRAYVNTQILFPQQGSLDDRRGIDAVNLTNGKGRPTEQCRELQSAPSHMPILSFMGHQGRLSTSWADDKAR